MMMGVEDADTAGTDEQAYDDQHDSPNQLAAKDRDNSGEDEYDGNDPEDEVHAHAIPR
jgi:hypothetical protein